MSETTALAALLAALAATPVLWIFAVAALTIGLYLVAMVTLRIAEDPMGFLVLVVFGGMIAAGLMR